MFSSQQKLFSRVDRRRGAQDTNQTREMVIEMKFLRLLRAKEEGRLSENDYETRRAAIELLQRNT